MDNLVPESDLPESVSTPMSEVPEHDLPEGMSASNEVPEHDLPGAIDPKYETPGQQVLTGVEGATKGVLGPVATGLEMGAHSLGLDEAVGIDTSAEAQKGREDANPTTHNISEGVGLVGSMATGVGEAGLIAKGVGKLVPESLPMLGKIGSAALSGFIENGLIQGGDEISNAMLGKGDPEDPVSSALLHMGAAGLFGGAFSAVGKGSVMALQAAEDAKLGHKAASFLMGFGDAAHNEAELATKDFAEQALDRVTREAQLKAMNIPELNTKSYTSGMNARKAITNALKSKSTQMIADTAGAVGGGAIGGPAGTVAGMSISKAITPYVEKLIDKGITKTNSLVEKGVLKVLSSGNSEGLRQVIDYATKVNKGQNALVNHVEGLFSGSMNQAIDAYVDDKQRDKLRDYIEKGGVDQEDHDEQPYAEGGPVSKKVDGVALHYPTQNMLLNMAKGRVSGYLNSVRPMKHPKLPFDREMKDPAHETSYNRALDIALKPLSVLKHVQDGSILPEHVRHLSQMYPEVQRSISKKVTEQITKAQMDGKMPSYRLRQGLSLLMGMPMDSSFTPANIMAAQPKPVNNQPMPGGKQKGGKATTSSMVKQTKTYNTPNQAAEMDKSSRD